MIRNRNYETPYLVTLGVKPAVSLCAPVSTAPEESFSSLLGRAARDTFVRWFRRVRLEAKEFGQC